VTSQIIENVEVNYQSCVSGRDTCKYHKITKIAKITKITTIRSLRSLH